MNELFADGNVTSFLLCCNNSCYDDDDYYSSLCVCRLLRAVDSFFVVAFPRASCMSLRDQTSSIFVFGFARLFPLTSIFMAHAIIKKRRGKKNAAASREFCRRVIKKQQQSLSGSLLFIFFLYVRSFWNVPIIHKMKALALLSNYVLFRESGREKMF